jgi:hypothetical protein
LLQRVDGRLAVASSALDMGEMDPTILVAGHDLRCPEIGIARRWKFSLFLEAVP